MIDFSIGWEEILSTRAAVTIVSRAMAIYFLAWLVYDLTTLPVALFTLSHHQLLMSASREDAYWRNYYLTSLVFLLLRMLALFVAVQWFYRSGPRIHQYFLAPSDNETSAG